MREEVKNQTRLLHIIEAIDNIFEFTNGKDLNAFNNDKILKFAIIKNLEIVGEAAYFLTNDFKKKTSHIEWETIIAMRHVLVHGYYQIKNEIISNTIQIELNPLREQISNILKDIKETNQ